ncbi:unnamed protein product [Trichogramma brassicae]|uniref:Uncharacterized protein n=1 Tax=Trichogramma brassicae TaxID=86971 RepID=A0A6H5I5C0_9HYME|nr:unnamed protein product [Trichogramma brassicae]
MKKWSGTSGLGAGFADYVLENREIGEQSDIAFTTNMYCIYNKKHQLQRNERKSRTSNKYSDQCKYYFIHTNDTNFILFFVPRISSTCVPLSHDNVIEPGYDPARCSSSSSSSNRLSRFQCSSSTNFRIALRCTTPATPSRQPAAVAAAAADCARTGRASQIAQGPQSSSSSSSYIRARQSFKLYRRVYSRLLRGHTLLASPPELDIFFRTRCLVPSCECGSRFCRRWQVPNLLCRLHLVSVVLASGATLEQHCRSANGGGGSGSSSSSSSSNAKNATLHVFHHYLGSQCQQNTTTVATATTTTTTTAGGLLRNDRCGETPGVALCCCCSYYHLYSSQQITRIRTRASLRRINAQTRTHTHIHRFDEQSTVALPLVRWQREYARNVVIVVRTLFLQKYKRQKMYSTLCENRNFISRDNRMQSQSLAHCDWSTLCGYQESSYSLLSIAAYGRDSAWRSSWLCNVHPLWRRVALSLLCSHLCVFVRVAGNKYRIVLSCSSCIFIDSRTLYIVVCVKCVNSTSYDAAAAQTTKDDRTDYCKCDSRPEPSFEESWDDYRLRLASCALAIVERLEKGGYELNRSDASTIMTFFDQYRLFEKSEDTEELWYNDEEFAMEAKKVRIRPGQSLINDIWCDRKELTSEMKEILKRPSLSLYDLTRLPPEDAQRKNIIRRRMHCQRAICGKFSGKRTRKLRAWPQSRPVRHNVVESRDARSQAGNGSCTRTCSGWDSTCIASASMMVSSVLERKRMIDSAVWKYQAYMCINYVRYWRSVRFHVIYVWKFRRTRVSVVCSAYTHIHKHTGAGCNSAHCSSATGPIYKHNTSSVSQSNPMLASIRNVVTVIRILDIAVNKLAYLGWRAAHLSVFVLVCAFSLIQSSEFEFDVAEFKSRFEKLPCRLALRRSATGCSSLSVRERNLRSSRIDPSGARARRAGGLNFPMDQMAERAYSSTLAERTLDEFCILRRKRERGRKNIKIFVLFFFRTSRVQRLL